MFRNMRHPDRYHGRGTMRGFFEGWYFKLATADKKRVIALIPGIFWGQTDAEHHSFLQVLDGDHISYDYIKMPPERFQAADRPFKVELGANSFSLDSIRLQASSQQTRLFGGVDFAGQRAWRSSRLFPGSMGAYNYIPGLQCYSQVCLMDAELSGALSINGEAVNFEGGRVYVEKNWGKAFPYSWIWVQCNAFDERAASLSCSIGHIPFGPGSFRGHLVGLYHGEQFFAFTTMNRSRLTIRSLQPDVRMELENRRYWVEITTQSDPDTFILCRGPRGGEMVPMVWETLQGKVTLRLYDKRQRQYLLETQGERAGIEYGGDQMQIIDGQTEQTSSTDSTGRTEQDSGNNR